MQLTEHFADTELGVAGCAQNIVDNATYLCAKLLEPVRAEFGPVAVHDGYRDPAHNARVGGKPNSYHLFEGGKSAADISGNFSLQTIFDWIRLESGLSFDKVILEFRGGFPACVHLQVNSHAAPRRLAFTGSTGAGVVYLPAQVR